MRACIFGRNNAANISAAPRRILRVLILAAKAALLGVSLPLAAQAPGGPDSAASPPLAPPTAAAFAKIPFVEDVVMSPDGNRMAGLFGVGGAQRIAIVSLTDKGEKPVQVGVPDGTEASWVRWVNDDNIIVGLTSLLAVDGGDRWYISRLIAIHRPTGKVTKLLWDSGGQDAASVLWIPSDGSTEILVQAQMSIYLGENFWPAVYRIDVATGRSRKILPGRDTVMDWTADAEGNIRTGKSFLNGGRRFKLLYRSPGGGSFRTIDTANTAAQENVLSPQMFLPGTDHAIAMHDDAAGRAAIYEVNLSTLQDLRTVFSAPAGAEVSSAIFSKDGKTLLGATTTKAGAGVHWIDPALAALQAQFDKSVGTRRARILSFNADRSRMLVNVGAPDTPGALFFFDVNDGTLRRVADFSLALGTRRLAPVRMVRYRARDGLEIEAVLTLPPGGSQRALPIVVMPHGGPWAQDGLEYDYWAQFIASRGYAVLQPNFRGSTGYGTEFLRRGEGQMGLAMQDDLTDGLRWAATEGLADPARACIVGASYGGYAAMWGIAKDPDIYRCAISIAGVANLRREVNDMGDSLLGRSTATTGSA